MPKTRKKPWWSGWRGKSPNKKQRKTMKKRCGKKCFLGPNLSFPICAKGTCRRNKRGIMSAYIRAKQWGKPKSFYKNYWGKPRMKRKVYTRVAKKARKLMGWKKGGRRRTKRRRRRITRKKRIRGGAWGPAPLAPLPNNHPWTFNELRADVSAIIEKQAEIIAAINDCHPGGCPGPAVAAPVLPPVANPIPPPPMMPPPRVAAEAGAGAGAGWEPQRFFVRNVRARHTGGRRIKKRHKRHKRTRHRSRKKRMRRGGHDTPLVLVLEIAPTDAQLAEWNTWIGRKKIDILREKINEIIQTRGEWAIAPAAADDADDDDAEQGGGGRKRRLRRGGHDTPVVLPIPTDDKWNTAQTARAQADILRNKINEIIQTRGEWAIAPAAADDEQGGNDKPNILPLPMGDTTGYLHEWADRLRVKINEIILTRGEWTADEPMPDAAEQGGGGRKRSQRGGVKGTIVHWNSERGNGVIKYDHDETQTIGFHFTSAGLGSYEPSVGDKVEFNVNDSRIPRRAKDVVKLQEPEPMEIDFDQGAQEECKKNQKEKCITYLKKLGLSQDDAELVAAPFLSGKTHLAELEQKLQALVREHIGKGGGGGGGAAVEGLRRRRGRSGLSVNTSFTTPLPPQPAPPPPPPPVKSPDRGPPDRGPPREPAPSGLDAAAAVAQVTAAAGWGSQYRCVMCGKPADYKCAQCLDAFYCNRECQDRHCLEGHQEKCPGKKKTKGCCVMQGGSRKGRRKRRRTRKRRRRRRGGMNPQGNSGAPNLQKMEGDNQNENTAEIHNVENASGNAMQKQAGKAGVVEGGNAATLSHEPPKKKTLAEWKEIYRKRSHSWS